MLWFVVTCEQNGRSFIRPLILALVLYSFWRASSQPKPTTCYTLKQSPPVHVVPCQATSRYPPDRIPKIILHATPNGSPSLNGNDNCAQHHIKLNCTVAEVTKLFSSTLVDGSYYRPLCPSVSKSQRFEWNWAHACNSVISPVWIVWMWCDWNVSTF